MAYKKGNKDEINSNSVIYAFAHCETWLEDYSKTIQANQHELTNRVAELLLAQGQRFSTSLPTLRRNSSKISKGLHEMEMVKRSYRKASRKISKRTSKGVGIKAYWAQFTPEQRSKMMIKRMSK
jgi:hypothetical protein